MERERRSEGCGDLKFCSYFGLWVPVGVGARPSVFAVWCGAESWRWGGGGEKGNSIILLSQMSTYHNLMGWDMESWFGKGGA